MAAPEFVPTDPTHRPRSYASPPRYAGHWRATRPGDIVGRGGQPPVDAGRMGAPGPDQGYLLKLVPLLRDELRLEPGENLADVEAGGAAVALKRASLFGRAPILDDLRVAYAVWGYFDSAPPADLVIERSGRFEGVHLTAHHYPELRALVDAVPEATLRLGPTEVAEQAQRHWRSLVTI